MAEKVYYRAERSFYPTPDQSNCIVLEIGDILEVNQYDEPSNGWMLGKRLQTEDYGYFPQSYVQLCSLPMEKPVPKPRMPKGEHDSGFFRSPDCEPMLANGAVYRASENMINIDLYHFID